MSNIFCEACIPEVIENVCCYLSFNETLPLSQSSKKLYEFTSRSNIWREVCSTAEIVLESADIPRWKFFEKIEAYDSHSLVALGKLLSDHVYMKPNYTLAQTFFELAWKYDQTEDSESHSAMLLNIEKLECMHGDPASVLREMPENLFYRNEMPAKFLRLMAVNVMQKTGSKIREMYLIESARREFQLLQDIKEFRGYMLSCQVPQNFDALYVGPTCAVSLEMRLLADSLRCYQLIFNYPRGRHFLDKYQGECLLEELSRNPQANYSIHSRIRLLKALRQCGEEDNDLRRLEVYNIFKEATSNEGLFFEERIFIKELMLNLRVGKKIDDSLLTIDECLAIVDEIYQQSGRCYYCALAYVMLFEISSCVPSDLVEKAIFKLLEREPNENKSLNQYSKVLLVKLYDEGRTSKISFKQALTMLSIIRETPAQDTRISVDNKVVFQLAIKLLKKFNQLKEAGFEYLAANQQLEILRLKIENGAELVQIVQFSLAEQYFQSYRSHLDYRKVLTILKEVTATPIDYDESAKIRWEERYIKAKQIIEKEIEGNGNCILQ
jgi:hypothetical protein